MPQNDPRLQFMLEEAASEVNVREEIEKIIADVKAVRAGSIQDVAAAVKDGRAPGPVDIGAAIVKRVLLAEHDLEHSKIAVFEIRGHAVYEIMLKSKAQKMHPRKIQEALKKGLGSAYDEHACQGWRDEWLPLVWGVWVQQAFRNDSARPFFCQVVPKSIDVALVMAAG